MCDSCEIGRERKKGGEGRLVLAWNGERGSPWASIPGPKGSVPRRVETFNAPRTARGEEGNDGRAEIEFPEKFRPACPFLLSSRHLSLSLISFFTSSSSSRFAGRSVIFHEFFATRKRRPFVSLPELFEYARESFITRKPCCCCRRRRRCCLDDSPRCQMKTSEAR